MSSKLDEMRAYVGKIADLYETSKRYMPTDSTWRAEDSARHLVATHMLTLALAAIDEARAEERARCVGALRALLEERDVDSGYDALVEAIEMLEALT